MGFFSSVAKAVGGAALGYATGGVSGAITGGLSGLSGGLAGGGGLTGGSTGTGSSQSGFALLPQPIQSAYTNYATKVNDFYSNPATVNAFAPTSYSALGNKAFASSLDGFTPTQESLNSDIAMQTNPFDSYVVDGINREAQGQYSILKQAQNEAGQFGSNRGILGANDIDLSRLQQVGQFKQGNFQQAMQNALTTLPGLRQQDYKNQLAGDAILRDWSDQNRQAAVKQLQAQGAAVGALPNNGGSISNSSQQSSQGGSLGALSGIGGLLNGLGGISGGGGFSSIAQSIPSSFASIPSFFSDIRLKTDVQEEGVSASGHKLYRYKYLGGHKTFRGVMAQDVIKTHPEAVEIAPNGYMKVNYDMLGVEMEVLHG